MPLFISTLSGAFLFQLFILPLIMDRPTAILTIIAVGLIVILIAVPILVMI